MGLEAAVTVAVDDPLSRHGADVVVGVAGDLAAVGEGQVRQRVALSLGAADHGGSLGAGQSVVGIEIQAAVFLRAGDDAFGIKCLDCGNGVFRDDVQIREGQRHISVLALVQLQIAVEHDGELGPADILVGAEGAVTVAGGNVGIIQEVHIGGGPVIIDVTEFVVHVVGIDVHAGPADIAGGIHSGNGDPQGLPALAGGGERVLEGTGLGVIVFQRLRDTVSRHRNGGSGQNAVHQIGDLHADRLSLLIQCGCHRRRGVIHRAGEGGYQLVDINCAAAGGVGVGHLNMVPSGIRSGGCINDHAAQGEVLGQRHVDLLPAGEVQRGDGQLQVALDVTGVEERELVAGAVAVDPEVQGCVGRLQIGEGACHGLRIVAGVLREHIVQLSGVMASLDIVAGIGAGNRQIVAAEEARIRSFKVLDGLQGHLSHRDGDSQALVPGGDRQVSGAGGGGGEHAVLIHRADVPGNRPGKGFIGCRQRQMVPDGPSGESGLAAGGHGKLRQVGGTVFQGQIVRVADGVDHGAALGPPARGRHGDIAAGGGGSQQIAAVLLLRNAAGAGGQCIAGIHGDVIAVHTGGCDGHGTAGQHIVTGGVDVEMIQPPAGAVRGH